MKENSLKDRFNYWLDKKMSKGTVSIIRLLSLTVLSVVVFVSILIIVFKLRDSFFAAFWDSLATIVNAWMPSSEDGQIGYLALNTLTAIVGLLFTSILIGVVSSAIEEKLNELRSGNSIVLEKDHTVILGYNFGEHGLLRQLILASEGKKRTFVIFTDLEKTELEQDLQNNVEIPDNIEVICRHGDITNINNLKCCAIDKAKVIIINALNDNRRIKAVLAVSMLKKEYPQCKADIISCVSSDRYLLPQNKIEKKNMIMLKTDDIMAKMIARTSTEPGLSLAFKELLNFEGNELYFEQNNAFYGKSVFQLARIIDNAVLVGIKHEGETQLNPDRDRIVEQGDEILLFEIRKGSYFINDAGKKNVTERISNHLEKENKGKLFIFGNNVLLKTILKELPDDVKDITIIKKQEDTLDLNGVDTKRFILNIIEQNYDENLGYIASQAGHIVILTDRQMEREDSDIQNILLLLKLMDLKERMDYNYNITVELNMENSYNVSLRNSSIDYIVGSNIASLILAQMSENPGLESVFAELLSKKGNELYSKSLKPFNLADRHDYSYAGLKQIVLSYGYTLLGYFHNNEMHLNLKSTDRVQFDIKDRLIVLGKE